eukprot:TRINITY_DN6589_c0_g1_i1.p1 TRINITY_DN6589_c0_g1~~TRINITY_DN6589_c0_g1_i1.p1  ORF type:complete len:201 (-),score=26.63 TRINITY_DN6589_c0_g1_i1:37-639(-)
MLIPCIILPIVISYARINLGVHYPTDCIAGVIVGIVICAIAQTIWEIDMNYCGDCGSFNTFNTSECYVVERKSQISPEYIDINASFLIPIVCAQILYALICVVKPLEYWNKISSFGYVFPAFLFRFLFICPNVNGYSLSPPETITNWWTIIVISTIVLLVTGGGALYKKKPFVLWMISYLLVGSTLFGWRVYVDYYFPKM